MHFGLQLDTALDDFTSMTYSILYLQNHVKASLVHIHHVLFYILIHNCISAFSIKSYNYIYSVFWFQFDKRYQPTTYY